jgi:ubiquinone/menaquinone biosynthesis C-methylase UbiE
MVNRQDTSPNSSDWDHYWKQQNLGQRTYGLIANFYRKFIIRRTLNHHIAKLYSPNSVLLHAGSGSGEVDVELTKTFRITAIDFSTNALQTYIDCHPNQSVVAQADLFCLPFQDASFDGVFNLGVMEHFNDEEIVRALIEVKRVLKPNGKIILFWPPIWGLSVIVLHSVHFVFLKVFKKDVNLHPAELNLLKSKKKLIQWCSDANLRVTEFKFGPRDFFTHQIVVLTPPN